MSIGPIKVWIKLCVVKPAVQCNLTEVTVRQFGLLVDVEHGCVYDEHTSMISVKIEDASEALTEWEISQMSPETTEAWKIMNLQTNVVSNALMANPSLPVYHRTEFHEPHERIMEKLSEKRSQLFQTNRMSELLLGSSFMPLFGLIYLEEPYQDDLVLCCVDELTAFSMVSSSYCFQRNIQIQDFCTGLTVQVLNGDTCTARGAVSLYFGIHDHWVRLTALVVEVEMDFVSLGRDAHAAFGMFRCPAQIFICQPIVTHLF